MTNSTTYSPEWELPTGIQMNRWARPLWWKRHPSGAVCVVWQLQPLNLYVVGWSSWAGGRVIPKLKDGAFEYDPAKVTRLVSELGERVFAAGPSVAMIGDAKAVRAKYARNGEKGGRGNRRASRASATPWPVKFPGHSFTFEKQRICLRAGRTAAFVETLCSDSVGKDLAWWNTNGPTQAMVTRLAKTGPQS